MMYNIDNMLCFVNDIMNKKHLTKDNTPIFNYVMKNENGLVKIGISKDVNFRKKILEYASGYEIPEVFKVKSISKASSVESKLHQYFKTDNKLGEWYNLDYKKAIDKTKEFSKLVIDEKNKINKSNPTDALFLMSTIKGDDESMLDYIVMSICLSKNDPNSIIELIKIYVGRYITDGGLESYNLFSLYLLFYLKEKYNILKIDLDDHRECFLCGQEVDITDKRCDFCGSIDFYMAAYTTEHTR